MRVLLLDNSVAVTGAFLSALAIAEAMADTAEFELVLPRGSEVIARAEQAGYRVHVLPMVEIGRSAKRLTTYVPLLALNTWRLYRLVMSRRADVLIANDYYNLLSFGLRRFGWRGRIVTIVRLLPRNQHPVLNRVWIAAMRFASDEIVAVSHAVQEQIPDACKAKLIYFPVGRGLEAVPYTSPPETVCVHFVYLANYIRGKGQELALQAFSQIAATNPDARLAFVGGDMGLHKNAAFRDELMNQSQALGIGNVVAFEAATDEVVGVIQAADVILNFSDSESFSQTCVEAALLGRPVIATRCGGPEEIIEQGVTGILVGLQNIEEMASAMQRLADSKNERQSMGKLALDHARLRFGSTQFEAQFLPLLLPKRPQ